MFCALKGATRRPRRARCRQRAVAMRLLPAQLDVPCTIRAGTSLLLWANCVLAALSACRPSQRSVQLPFHPRSALILDVSPSWLGEVAVSWGLEEHVRNHAIDAGCAVSSCCAWSKPLTGVRELGCCPRDS